MKKIILTVIASLTSLGAAAQPQLREDNIGEVLAAMTLQEKATLLVGGSRAIVFEGVKTGYAWQVPGACGSTRPIERLGIPVTILADGPAGLRIAPTRKDTDQTFWTTGFPCGTLLASSWDSALLEEVGAAIGEEVHEYGVDVLLAPGVNIHRNPLCGRNFEYYSEDPLLSGSMATAYIKGVQSKGVGVSIKHFAANNQETARVWGDSRVSERALREIYLKAFEMAVRDAAPWTVMSSYNKINGEYAQQNRDLLTTVLRDEWGFDGIVMTDWGKKAGTVKAVQAGNDLMEPGYDEEIDRIVKAVEDGSLEMADVDRNVRNMLRYIVRTPSFKHYAFSNKPELEDHAALARRAAAQACVLLKNEGETLPLGGRETVALYNISSIDFVAGGTGSGSISKSRLVDLRTGLEKAGFTVSGSQDAEVAIVVIGRSAGEARDRSEEKDFLLSDGERRQLEDISSAFHAQGKKVVVLLNICGVVETASWKHLADAILLPWAPGQEGGHAVADVLAGRVSPSGRLTMTFPVSYADDPSASNFPGHTQEYVNKSDNPRKDIEYVNYEEGIFVGYRHYVTKGKEVSYPFGYGLGYTSFAWSRPSVKKTDDGFEARITVTNKGGRPGRDVVQLYVSAPAGGLEKPERELKGFAKTRELQPGESETLRIRVNTYALASYNEDASCWETASGVYKLQFGANARDIRANASWKQKKAAFWKAHKAFSSKAAPKPAGNAVAKEHVTVIQPLKGEYWWGAVVNKGYAQPFTNFEACDNFYLDWPHPKGPRDGRPFNLANMSAKGTTVPLLLSSKGRYVWGDRPFSFLFKDGVLTLTSKYEKLEPVVAGSTLKEAYQAACAAHFPFDGREPAELMFTKPQFNNWIETVVLGINQENAETFVDKLHESGFPCGVVMIDGGWQRYHGCRDFNPDTFPEPQRLFDKIHGYGYKGVLWIAYFLSPDSRPEYTSYKPGMQDILVHSKRSQRDPALVWWWNGISVTMDLTRADIREKFIGELKDMAQRFHFDGYKFDGGDPEYFRGDAAFSEPWMEEADFGKAWQQVGEAFPYNEYRAGYNNGGTPLVLRHYDVGHTWTEFQAVIPNLTTAGLLGYPYVFADMIGGGLSGSYMPGKTFSHKLFLRSCEAQALMPMMQFSAAPWRVLTPEECEVCRRYAQLHVDFGPYIMEQVHHASATGEPIMRSMEYEFPGCGYEKVDQQFMLGPRYLVAPVTHEDDSKTVYLPAGRWRDDQGKLWRGPKVLELKDIPVERLPYYEKLR